MKRIGLSALACAVALLTLAPRAGAVLVSVTYTGDNIIGAWFQDGSAPVSQTLGPNAGNWQAADTAVLNLAPDSYQLIFRVANIGTGSSGNPAALLAQISGTGVSGDLLTSASWEWAPAGGSDPSDFNSLTWAAATTYGTNGGSNIWTNVNSGPISGISSSAEWIWNDVNFSSGTASELYLRAEINVVPEPTTLLLLGAGLAGLAGFGIRRRRSR